MSFQSLYYNSMLPVYHIFQLERCFAFCKYLSYKRIIFLCHINFFKHLELQTYNLVINLSVQIQRSYTQMNSNRLSLTITSALGNNILYRVAKEETFTNYSASFSNYFILTVILAGVIC